MDIIWGIIKIIYFILAYSLILIGWYMLNYNLFANYKSDLIEFYRNQKVIRQMRIIQKQKAILNTSSKTERNLLQKLIDAVNFHIELLLRSVHKKFRYDYISYFYIASLGLSAACGIVIWQKSHSTWITVLSAILGLIIIYISYLLRLRSMRSSNNYEMKPLVDILVMKYRYRQKHIVRALIDTKKEITNKSLNKALNQLLDTFMNFTDHSDLNMAVKVFEYQIGGNWAKQLGVLLIEAAENKDIEIALQEMSKEMGDIIEIIEREKSENLDSIYLGIFSLVAFPLSIIGIVWLNGPIFLDYQFNTPTGIKSFVITTIFTFLGFIISILFKKPSNDI